MTARKVPPVSALALILALGGSLDEPRTRRGRHTRHEVWSELRNQRDPLDRRLYTLAEIGSWWGVSRCTVRNALTRLDALKGAAQNRK